MPNPKSILKLTAFFSIFLLILYGVNFALRWQNPNINSETNISMHSCIYNNDYISTVLSSMDTRFEINFVENAGKDCFNPYFPIIHIKTNQEHNAWLHIVRTDCPDTELQQFIDSDVAAQSSFYTLDQDFYDAPLWRYTLFSKPLSYWVGHAYAVKVDHERQTIKVIGGIKWGFKLSYFPIKPQMISPSSLSLEDWQTNWEVFKQKLKEYKLD